MGKPEKADMGVAFFEKPGGPARAAKDLCNLLLARSYTYSAARIDYGKAATVGNGKYAKRKEERGERRGYKSMHRALLCIDDLLYEESRIMTRFVLDTASVCCQSL
jgi:hypothetical protein